MEEPVQDTKEQLPTNKDTHQKECLACHRHLGSSEFSSRQWRSGWSLGRRCFKCVRENRSADPPQSAAEPKPNATTSATTKQCSECRNQVVRSGMSTKMWRSSAPVCLQCQASPTSAPFIQAAFEQAHQGCLLRACQEHNMTPEETEDFIATWMRACTPNITLKFPRMMASSIVAMMEELEREGRTQLRNRYREVWCCAVKYLKEILFPALVAKASVAAVESNKDPPWPECAVTGFLITTGASNGRRAGAQKEFQQVFEQWLPQYTIKALAGVGKCFVFFQLVDSEDEKNCDEDENNNNDNKNNRNDTDMSQNKRNSDTPNPHFILNQLYSIATNLQFRFCEVVTPLQCCLPLTQTQEISTRFQAHLGPLSSTAAPSTYGIDFKCHDRDPPVPRKQWLEFFANLVPVQHKVCLRSPQVVVQVRVFAAGNVQQVGFLVRAAKEISRTPRDVQDYHQTAAEGQPFYKRGINLQSEPNLTPQDHGNNNSNNNNEHDIGDAQTTVKFRIQQEKGGDIPMEDDDLEEKDTEEIQPNNPSDNKGTLGSSHFERNFNNDSENNDGGERIITMDLDQVVSKFEPRLRKALDLLSTGPYAQFFTSCSLNSELPATSTPSSSSSSSASSSSSSASSSSASPSSSLPSSSSAFSSCPMSDSVEEEKTRESSNRKRKLRAERSDGQVEALAQHVLSELGKSNVSDRQACCTVEFGAGKGSLTKGIRKAAEDRLGGYVLVDRDRGLGGTNKRVADNESVWSEDGCVRLRIDMANLWLEGLPYLKGKSTIGVGKHVCGAATDLALRCLVPAECSPSHPAPVAVVIALCCYHRCSWSAYLNQEWVSQSGFSSVEFEQIVKITSWCHIRGRQDADSLTRARLADVCKQFIDAGRVLYLLQRGLQATVAPFVKSSLTLENKALLAHRAV